MTRRHLFGLLAALLVSTTSHAATIVYTFKGTLTGSLGASALNETAYELVITSDTSTVATSFSLSTLIYNPGSAVLSLAGLGDSNVLAPLDVGIGTANGVIGFTQDYFPCGCDPSADSVTYSSGGALIGYDLTTTISDQPLSYLSSFLLPESFALDSGILNIVDVGTEGFFSARVVPIPAAIWQFSAALLGLLGIARRTR